MNRPALALILLLAACSQRGRYVDAGEACLGEPQFRDTGTTLAIVSGDSVPVTVVLSTCSSGSTQWLDQTCTASVDGHRVVVATTGVTRTPLNVTADCRWISQECGTVELTDGDWTLVYGDGGVAFSVPYEGEPICAANPTF